MERRCEECARAVENPERTLFNNLACVHCAARLIQRLATLPISKEECSARRTAALVQSVAHGLDEQEIRDLVKAGALAIQPKPAPAKKSEPAKKGKK